MNSFLGFFLFYLLGYVVFALIFKLIFEFSWKEVKEFGKTIFLTSWVGIAMLLIAVASIWLIHKKQDPFI